MVASIFDISESEIAVLDEKLATDFWARVLNAEAYRIGLPLSSVTISMRTKVPDGGVDARVDDLSKATSPSNIFMGERTSYQIKSGKFSPLSEPQIKKELFDSSAETDIRKEKLGKETLDCLENNGTYVLVCFGKDLISQERTRAENLMKLHGLKPVVSRFMQAPLDRIPVCLGT